MTDHTTLYRNSRNFPTKIFHKSFHESVAATIDGPACQVWVHNELFPAWRSQLPGFQARDEPSFDQLVDLTEKRTWVDSFGRRDPENPTTIVHDILDVVRLDFAEDPDSHDFGTWLAEPQEDGSRFYSIFRQGFLTPAEIHQLRIPSVVLEGNDLRDYNLYLQNLTEATSALAPPNP
jgi:hypothetical protein